MNFLLFMFETRDASGKYDVQREEKRELTMIYGERKRKKVERN